MESNSSIEVQLDNGVSIPYHSGLVMGHTVDFTKQLSKGRKIVADGQTPVSSKIDQTTCKFSLATSLSDVCEVLDIPHEYALKVEAGLLQNKAVEACLHDIYNKDAFKLIFSLRFIEERQHFFYPLSFTGSDSMSSPTNFIPGHELPVVSDMRTDPHDTHLIEALCIGDEVVIIMQVTALEFDVLKTFFKKIEKTLGKRSGFIEGEDVISTLKDMASSLDSKLSKSHYKNVKCLIQYCAFKELDTYPADVSGMVKVIEEFISKWKDTTDANRNSQIPAMTVRTGTDCRKTADDSVTYQKKTFASKELFNIRVTLQPNPDEEKATPKDDLRNASELYETVFSCLCAMKRTESLIEGFLTNHSLFCNKDYKFEGEEISTSVLRKKNEVVDFIESLNIVNPIMENGVQDLQQSLKDLPDVVAHFIEKVTTKLPNGGDLNLLIIGKTGHGKSSTANAILKRMEFKTSSGGISETKSCQKGWVNIDGRVLKVVDIPGVCDTDLDSVSSARLAMTCISEAITTCSEGFHALLLVIRYGNRMTEEEERAVYMLKCILGSTIVHSHCICVVTHGDNFDKNEGRFEDWCQKQEGFLKEIFEECNYRCVLFNNKTSDPRVLKTQLIELVSKVDGLEESRKGYTNEIFKHAERDRQRLIEELELPQFKEDILRDLNLLQGEFENIENANENEREFAMQSLKTKTEDLKGKLEEMKNVKIADLFQAVSNFSEKLSRMEEKELADAQIHLEREKFKQEEQRLRAEREVIEIQIAEQTKERIREAAQAAEQTQKELRDIERKMFEEKERYAQEIKNDMANSYTKKSRWVQFRDALFKW